LCTYLVHNWRSVGGVTCFIAAIAVVAVVRDSLHWCHDS
jgi:hypothetical protein